jgi:hypothetical protein
MRNEIGRHETKKHKHRHLVKIETVSRYSVEEITIKTRIDTNDPLEEQTHVSVPRPELN